MGVHNPTHSNGPVAPSITIFNDFGSGTNAAYEVVDGDECANQPKAQKACARPAAGKIRIYNRCKRTFPLSA